MIISEKALGAVDMRTISPSTEYDLFISVNPMYRFLMGEFHASCDKSSVGGQLGQDAIGMGIYQDHKVSTIAVGKIVGLCAFQRQDVRKTDWSRRTDIQEQHMSGYNCRGFAN